MQMTGPPDPARLRRHLERSVARHRGAMPVETALAWFGYLEALVQWGLLDFFDYEDLTTLLPPMPETPLLEITALPEQDKYLDEQDADQQPPRPRAQGHKPVTPLPDGDPVATRGGHKRYAAEELCPAGGRALAVRFKGTRQTARAPTPR
jgi:hypothetical protein